MRIAYVGSFQFPEGDAGAARVLGIGRALRAGGHAVVFFGIEKSSRPGDCACYDGFKYISPPPARQDLSGKVARQAGIFTGSAILSKLNLADRAEPFDAVIAYQAPSLLLLRLRSWCTRRSIHMLCDTVEWYDRGHVMGGKIGPMALDSELRMRTVQPMADGIIAISSLLTDYYSRKGTPSFCTPPLVDLQAEKWKLRIEKTDHAKLVLAFVGNAGKKDLLINAVKGIDLLGEAAKNCELIVCGPSMNEVRSALGTDSAILDKHKDIFSFTGRLPHREALSKLSTADFSILLRQDSRYAHAGFPTKLVESLAMGVPVICNITSDIGKYVTDGIEGIVITDCSPESFATGLNRALKLTRAEIEIMKQFSRRRAENSFDYRNWVKPISEFINKVVPLNSKC